MSDDTQTTKDSKSYIRLKNYRHTNRLNGKCAECGKPSENTDVLNARLRRTRENGTTENTTRNTVSARCVNKLTSGRMRVCARNAWQKNIHTR